MVEKPLWPDHRPAPPGTGLASKGMPQSRRSTAGRRLLVARCQSHAPHRACSCTGPKLTPRHVVMRRLCGIGSAGSGDGQSCSGSGWRGLLTLQQTRGGLQATTCVCWSPSGEARACRNCRALAQPSRDCRSGGTPTGCEPACCLIVASHALSSPAVEVVLPGMCGTSLSSHIRTVHSFTYQEGISGGPTRRFQEGTTKDLGRAAAFVGCCRARTSRGRTVQG